MADWLIRRTPGWRGAFLWLITEFATRAILVEALVLLVWRPPVGLPAAVHFLMEAYALAEVLFFGLYLVQKRRLTRRVANIPKQNHIDRHPLAERAAALEHILETIAEAIGPEGNRGDEVSSWFLRKGARAHDEAVPAWLELRTGNIADWLAWALWHCEPSNVDPAELRLFVTRVEQWVHEGMGATRSPVPEGHNSGLFACRLTLDELRCKHRPLLAYLVTHLALGIVNRSSLKARGFAHRQSGRIGFWHRRGGSSNTQGGSSAPRRPPIVFLAGIGVGLVSYLQLIDGLLDADPDREVILCELGNICLRLSLEHEVESPEQTVRRLREILASCGCESAHWVGHSFGTIVISWVLRLAPSASACAAAAAAAPAETATGSSTAQVAAAGMAAPATDKPDSSPRWPTHAATRSATAAVSNVTKAVTRSAPSCVAACTFVDPIPFLLYKANVAASFCYRPARTPLDRLVR